MLTITAIPTEPDICPTIPHRRSSREPPTMEVEPTTPTRQSLKRPLDAHSGQTPAPKRFQRLLLDQGDPESEDEDNQKSPTVAATSKKKKKQAAPRKTPDPAPHRPPPLRLPPATAQDKTKEKEPPVLPTAFAPSPPAVATEDPPTPPTETTEPNYTLSNEDLDAALEGYKEEWSLDPAIEVFDMSKIIDTAQNAKMPAKAPAQQPVRQEWHLIPPNPARPDLDHKSDNPFDFLPNAKLEKLIKFWKNEQGATASLTRVEKEFMGEPRIKKVLAKVVNVGSPTIENDRKCAWIRSAITSAIAQSGIETNDFDKLRIAMNPAKPSYSWIVIPVRNPVFKVLQNVRAALDPRSGTLVLLRTWREESFPIQRIYAFGIHERDDPVTLEVATADYKEQTEESLGENKITILSMNPCERGDARRYGIELKLGFAEGTTPFLIDPKKLATDFWTGLGNTKTKRSIEYKWPTKCRHCESESHLTATCPWIEIEMAGRAINVYNCRYHNPGWTEPVRRPRAPHTAATTEILDLRPLQERAAKLKKDKGKGKEMELDQPDPQ